MAECIMYQSRVPVVRECDVLVVGAGPAGVCAAVSAAREGAKVILCERYGSVGGMLTMGNVDPILGEVAGGTYYDEIVRRLAEIDKGTVPTTGTRIGRESLISAAKTLRASASVRGSLRLIIIISTTSLIPST